MKNNDVVLYVVHISAPCSPVPQKTAPMLSPIATSPGIVIGALKYEVLWTVETLCSRQVFLLTVWLEAASTAR